MRFDFISIFPQYFNALELSLMGKAVKKGQLSIHVHDLREWTADKHRSVDDAPYGGGAGMVMRADVWGQALDSVLQSSGRRVLAIPTPSGIPLTQEIARSLVNADQIVFACGRYEGIDYRVAEYYQAETDVEVLEYSIGDYVLNGGEVAALVLVESVSRLLDGFMSNPQSLVEESFENSLLEYPAYTRPLTWRGREVPAVLRSGDHAQIERWRREISLQRTATRRADLVAQLDPTQLSAADLETLAYYGWVCSEHGWAPLHYIPMDERILVASGCFICGEVSWSTTSTVKLPSVLQEANFLIVTLREGMEVPIRAGLLRKLMELELAQPLVLFVQDTDKALIKLARNLGFVKAGRVPVETPNGKRFQQVLAFGLDLRKA